MLSVIESAQPGNAVSPTRRCRTA